MTTGSDQQTGVFTLGHNANPTIIEDSESGQPPPDPSAASSTQVSASVEDAMATLLFAPSTITTSGGTVTGSAEVSSSQVESTSLSSLPSSSSFTLPVTAPAVSVSSSASSATASIPVTSTNASYTSASASASSSPMLTVSRHSPQFYVGLSFIGIVVLACLVSFVSWMVRSRRKRPAWCSGENENDDVENQDLGFGLGIYLEKPSESNDHLVKMPLKSVSEDVWSVQSAHAPNLPQASANLGSPGRFPQPPVRPSAAQGDSSISLEFKNQMLGPLHVKNYVPGDFSSSCDELARPIAAGRKDTPRTRYGMPREAQPGSTPRFLGVEGTGLSMQLPPINIKSSPIPSKTGVAHTPLQASVTARRMAEEDISPLPMPPFCDGVSDAGNGMKRADSWGNTLRTSIFSAWSGLTGAAAKPAEDRYTSLPVGSLRSGRWHEALFPRKDTSAGAALSGTPSNRLKGLCASPKAIDTELPFIQRQESGTPGQYIAAIGLGADATSGLDTPIPGPTMPLKLQKKRPFQHEQAAKDALSRTSSMYSRPATNVPTTLHTRVSKASTKRRCTLVQPTPPRPAFLRRATGSSATSFSSDCSDTSRELGEGEIIAKRMMRLRARRKQQMSATTGTGRRRATKNTPGSLSSVEGN